MRAILTLAFLFLAPVIAVAQSVTHVNGRAVVLPKPPEAVNDMKQAQVFVPTAPAPTVAPAVPTPAAFAPGQVVREKYDPVRNIPAVNELLRQQIPLIEETARRHLRGH